MELVGSALANNDNLTRLLDRCTDLMGIIIGKLDGNATDATAKNACVNILSRFDNLLKEIKCYCTAYNDTGFILRMLKSSEDAREYKDMAKRLSELTVKGTCPFRVALCYPLNPSYAVLFNSKVGGMGEGA